ncbi:MAG: hypothetical protein E7573_05855 [Ruminococcaceae bacterium]|nr:hypothetical protein [Oscillospiraceae bacterium]
MDTYFMAHIEDLSERSRNKSIFTFSDFLNEEEQNEIIINKKKLTAFTFFGGSEGTQRKMVRFGDEDELFYSEDFPIDCIKIEPLNIKFAEEISHRDCLGAVMNLSVKRELIGDIVIRDKTAYIFVTKKICPFICENLKRIRHTDVRCTTTVFEDSSALFNLEDIEIISSSLRADCVISSLYKLSRNTADELFRGKKVFINFQLCENTSKNLKENDTVSVRGFGKFIYRCIISETKKGRLKLSLQIYK